MKRSVRRHRGTLSGVNRVEQQASRREVLGGVILGGAGLAVVTGLSGCQSGGAATASSMPGPLWPDQQPKPWVPPKPAATPVPVAPAPQRQVARAAAPGIMPRGRWTRAGVIASRADPMNGINRITVHHTAVSSLAMRTESDAIKMMNTLRNGHVSRGWADIGYHYAIDPQGRVWEGRPLSWQGAHVENQNPHNLGIVLMGNFDQQSPTADQLAALDGFVAAQARRFRIPLDRIRTHQELAKTACPGRNLQRYMLATRSSGGGRMALTLA